MNSLSVFFVISLLLNLGSTFNLTKFIKVNNNKTVFMYQTLANNTNDNIAISTVDMDITINMLEFRDLDCNGISTVPTNIKQKKFTMPLWTENKFEVNILSELVNNEGPGRQPHKTYKQFALIKDGVKRTNSVGRNSHQEDLDVDPYNYVSTLKMNTSVFFGAVLSTLSNKEDVFHTNANANESITREYISTAGYYQYYEDSALDAKFISLPLSFKNTTMTIVFSESGDLHKLESQLDKVLATPDYKTSLLVVSLPVFLIKTKVDLKEIFDKNGDNKDQFQQTTFLGIRKDNVTQSVSTVETLSPQKEIKDELSYQQTVKIVEVYIGTKETKLPKIFLRSFLDALNVF